MEDKAINFVDDEDKDKKKVPFYQKKYF